MAGGTGYMIVFSEYIIDLKKLYIWELSAYRDIE